MNAPINLRVVIHEKERVYEFDVVILEDESGGYVTLVSALPGCHTQGDTIDEVLRNVKEAIELYLETLNATTSKDC